MGICNGHLRSSVESLIIDPLTKCSEIFTNSNFKILVPTHLRVLEVFSGRFRIRNQFQLAPMLHAPKHLLPDSNDEGD